MTSKEGESDLGSGPCSKCVDPCNNPPADCPDYGHPPMDVNDTGILGGGSYVRCPNCGAVMCDYSDLFGSDLVGLCECDACGAQFEITTEFEYHYWCVKAPKKGD